jgi:aminoglycoside N3'-acetyltransferase
MSGFRSLGVNEGDIILIRASLGAVGRIESGADTFINALLDAVGSNGTIVSLAFTSGSFLRKPKVEDAFTIEKKSYAGALPNAMLSRADSFRSMHPVCSFVAIGKQADLITHDHDANSPAYEPVRKIVEANGKCILVGCVGSSPGFTTTHLAEADLGYLKKLPILPWLNSTFYIDRDGETKLFRRYDPGLCSKSFSKFYSLYVEEEILRTGYIGKAYSILAPAEKAYIIDIGKLREDKKFNICGNPDCRTCNVGRWDRVHYMPGYLIRKIAKKLRAKIGARWLW